MARNKGKILVIDDEAHIRHVIALKLKNRGYEVLMAVNGKEGLNMINTEKPDVVISDIMMPGVDGRTLCEKTDGLKSDRPFLTIIMTCRISQNEQEWIRGMRKTLFMEKPFSPSHLLEQIERYIEVEN